MTDINAAYPSLSEQSFPALSTPSHTSSPSETTRITDSNQPLHALSAPSQCLAAKISDTLTANSIEKQDQQKVAQCHPKRKSLSLSKQTAQNLLTINSLSHSLKPPSLPLNPCPSPNNNNMDSAVLYQSEVELCKLIIKSTPTSNQSLSLPTQSRTALKNITNNSNKMKSSIKIKPETLQCSFCNAVYSTRSGLYKHLTKNHPEQKENKGSIRCQEHQCTFACRVLSELRTHLQEDHHIPMEFEDKTFESHEGNYYNAKWAQLIAAST